MENKMHVFYASGKISILYHMQKKSTTLIWICCVPVVNSKDRMSLSVCVFALLNKFKERERNGRQMKE